jgi:deoxyribonuclease V
VLKVPNLRQLVLELLDQVPRGRVTTYRALALALGDAVASRAVGLTLAETERNELHPWHRVINSDGQIGSDEKIRRLLAEGVPSQEGQIADLKRYVFYQFQTEKPLKALSALQDELADRVSTQAERSDFQTVGGVDLSYPNTWRGVGAYVRLDARNWHLLHSQTLETEVSFPYIPSYLALRELPVLLPLLSQVRDSGLLPDVLMVDGTGLLHPRHAGIASHLGVLLDLPTIGITKSLLYGKVDLAGMTCGEVRMITDPERENAVIGAALKTSERADPIFVSVGHRIDLDTAIKLTQRLSFGKLPEPIKQAHLACTRAAHPTQERESGQRSLGL